MSVESDFSVEEFGNRASGFCSLGRLLEGLGGCTRDLGFQLEMALSDRKTSVFLLQRDGTGGLKIRRLQSCLSKLGRERHREASGVCGRQQFFRVRALPLLEAAVERVGCCRERAARSRERPGAAFQIALPLGLC